MINIKTYDKRNIFSKILRGEIPCKTVFENDFILAFEDINPQAPVHVLIIPKENYCSLQDFSLNAGDKIILEMFRSIGKISKKLELENGYRIISNIGDDGGQEVPHFHIHILGKKKMTKILP